MSDLSKRAEIIAEDARRLNVEINSADDHFKKIYALAMHNEIIKNCLTLFEHRKISKDEMLILCISELAKQNTQFKELAVSAANSIIAEKSNCDHDWENMGDYMQCTYPECQAIKIKRNGEVSFDELKDGNTYCFTYKGQEYFGKYEALSGNFFVGGDETHQKHTHYFEAAACESIEYSAF